MPKRPRLSVLCPAILFAAICATAGHAADQEYSAAWAETAGGVHFDNSETIAIDVTGNVYIGGRFSYTAHFGPFSCTARPGIFNGFVAKLNSQGSWEWALPILGAHNLVWDIAVDDQGITYVVGEFVGTIQFGQLELEASPSAENLFAAAVSPEGEWMWVAQGVTPPGPGSGNVDPIAIAVDGQGVYITGDFNLSLSFGATTLTSGGSNEVFVAKLNLDGQWLWAKQINSTTGNTFVETIALDGAGNVCIGGMTHGTDVSQNALLVKFDNDGNLLWTLEGVAAGPGGAHVYDLSVDASGNAYIVGFFGGTVHFGTIELTYNPFPFSSTRFIAKVDSAGAWVWAIQKDVLGKEIQVTEDQTLFVNSGEEFDLDGNVLHRYNYQGDGVYYESVMDANRHIYLTGSYSGTQFAIGGIPLLESRGRSDVFVAKLVPLDSDQDLLSDYQEGLWGTNKHAMDSDGDGVIDGTEVDLSTDPLDPDEFPDGLPVNAVWLLVALLGVAGWTRARRSTTA